MINLKKILWLFLVFIFSPGLIFASEKMHDRFNLKAALLVDMDSGSILYKQNMDKLIPPASLSKIMTLYLVNEDIREGRVKLFDIVKISTNAVKTDGSKMFHEEGEKVYFGDLIQFMAIHSANDAAVAVAEHLSGSMDKFVERMNAKAKELGMKKSFFVNPHGLPDRHQLTTAWDIYILSRDYLQRFPDSLKIHSAPYFIYNYSIYQNRNTLLQENIDVDGLKTGYVRAAGYNLVATAKRGDRRLIAVVLGAKTPKIRDEQTKMLLEFGFRVINGKDQNSMVGA